MSKEIYHEGWLTKSPPTKRIWRARWRRRWFTLKQGEIPEQFCLEYYADRKCRKLKGVIDLDQCEQVDSGLRLEHRKQKFQHMFDVKTPRRTYYLAAETEEDMNDWVNCICQVCNLQDLSKQQAANNESRQYYNVGAEAIVNQPQAPLLPPSRINNQAGFSNQMEMKPSPDLIQSAHLNLNRSMDNNSVYQNFDAPFRHPSYTTRDTMICDTSLSQPANASTSGNPKEEYYNFPAIAEANRSQTFERSHSLRTTPGIDPNIHKTVLAPCHGRTQSLIEQRTSVSAFGRRIPENLKLDDRNAVKDSEHSPALSTSSGPYIAISECISGDPVIDRDHPSTPLNSLDPKFYETPRNHINIGLNLTNEQPYSPKRNNCPVSQVRQIRSERSSPTDSESVFTDDEEWVVPVATEGTADRRLRPSDSSVENDSIVFTYAQRFSKFPGDDDETTESKGPAKRPKRATGLVLAENNASDQNRETNSSDTENASPAISIGPKDVSSCVDENYDIPRSHHMPYYNINNNNNENVDEQDISPTLIANNDAITASTPNLADKFSTLAMASTPQSKFSTMQHRPRPHFYTNAAPTKVEGNVFRYDFDEQVDAPVVNRKLKPKVTEEKEAKEPSLPRPVSIVSTTSSIGGQSDLRPPCIDRKLKPSTPQKHFETSSLRRKGGPTTLSLTSSDTEFQSDHNADAFSKTLPRNYNNTPMTVASSVPPTKQIGKLEYFDLDHSNAPSICKNATGSVSTTNLPSASNSGTATASSTNRFQQQRNSGFVLPPTSVGGVGSMSRPQMDGAVTTSGPTVDTGIVYKSVDFIKTEAFMRTRQDAEKNRNLKNRTKD